LRQAVAIHMKPHRYFIVHKPYDMVSQFVSTHAVGLLGDLDFDFPEGTHAVGRLDNHSEGLLILTSNKKLTRLLFQSEVPHRRTYLVQVSNTIDEEKLNRLRNGISIRVKLGEYYTTSPCEVKVLEELPAGLLLEDKLTAWPPFTWLSISITEGKFHQVRKMIGALHHRCKRLIRISIEDLSLNHIPPGTVKEISEEEIFKKLKINSK
jgi:23S rRNA pseudouridine2457 synthase